MIRFLYCRAPIVSNIISKIITKKIYTWDFIKHNELFFDKMINVFQKNNIQIKDKIILELWPWNSYINAFNFLMQWAKKVYLVDKFPRIIENENQKNELKREIEYIKNKYQVEKLDFIDEDLNINSDYIEFLKKDLTEITEIEKIDIIISKSVLEHIKNIEKNIEKMWYIINKWWIMYHHIDMRDHYNFNKPFLFYKYSETVWNNLMTKEWLSYTNRW